MSKRRSFIVMIAGALCLYTIKAPVFVSADTSAVGPGGSIEVEEGGSVEYDTGEGQGTDNIHIDDNENTEDETTESNANGSTNQTYVDDRTQDEKDLNRYYVQLRDLVASWRDKCTGSTSYLGLENDVNNITTIQYGVLSMSDIQQAKEYLDAFNALRTNGDVDDYWSGYFYSFDMRDSSSGYSATASPSVTGVETLKSGEMTEIKGNIAENLGLSVSQGSPSAGLSNPLGLGLGGLPTISESFTNPISLNVSAPDYVNGSPIRTDIIPGGLNNASSGSWFRDIESLYRYLDLQTPESLSGSHGQFQSNAMNDFCSIALIRNYKVQEVVNEKEVVGDPISDDYQIHLFSEDSGGNRTEIDVLTTNQRINTIKLSDYPGVKKLIAQTYRKFNLTTYTRVSYAEYEYLIDTGTNNILWFSEHSMESNSVGKTGCRTITMNVVTGQSGWTADPNEAEITIRDMAALTENETVTERID